MESNTWSSQSGAQGEEGTWFDPEFYLPSDKNQGATCWKTNLMLRDEVTRVQERGRDFKRRTSFEDNLINQHIEQMLKTIRSTDLRVRQMEFPKSDRNFLSIRSSKHIQDISSNSYFTEQEKWEFTACMLENQQNFSIFFRFSPIFEENRHELIYLLAKILSFCTVDLEITVKHNTTQDSIIQMLENNRLKLVDGILGQEIVKVVNPIFFSNVNEEPLMRIVDSWFYHILCVKQGLYGMEFQEQGETRFIEENLFME